MKAFFMKLLKDKAMKKAGESLSENGISLSPLFKYSIVGGGFAFAFLGFIIVIFVLLAPIMFSEDLVSGFKESFSSFFEKTGNLITLKGWCTDEECDDTFDEKYYKKLSEVYQDYQDDGVDLNVNLITATIYYNSSIGREDDEDLISDIKPLASHMVSGNSLDYNKYREYLIDTYIPKRFKHLYNDDKGKEKIANDIMSFADKNKKTVAQSIVGANCSQVSMRDEDGEIKILPLEEYVAGVVSAENDYGVEASKMQAIAARTNAVSHCNSVIENSTNFQKYVTPSSSGIATAEATKGLILTYNGEVLKEMAFASYPRAFYKDPKGFKGYYEKGALCGDVVCSEKSDGRRWCQTTIYKLPGLESFTLDMPDKDLNGKYWNNFSLSNQGGHCYGVSQVATRYYEDELHYDYKKMIETFFSEGVEISDMSTVVRGLIAGGKYTSNAPLYNTSAEFFSNINYNYWASTSAMPDPQNYGECPWYAKGRAIELIANSNMSDDLKSTLINSLRNTGGNGSAWYAAPSDQLFQKSNDLYAAREGSIVSWSGGSDKCSPRCGHVGIVEKVEYDDNGRAKRILLSEGWNGTGNPANASYSMKWWDIESFKRYNSNAKRTYYFNGYVYLLG